MSKADQLRAMREANFEHAEFVKAMADRQAAAARAKQIEPPQHIPIVEKPAAIQTISQPPPVKWKKAGGKPFIPGFENIARPRGRPKDCGNSLRTTEPWRQVGMSRRTWFRRRALTLKGT